MEYKTVVYSRKDTHYNQYTGKYTSELRVNPDINLSKTLCDKLLKFAVNELNELGFPIFENVEISTMDAEDNVYDRSYQLEFTNDKGNGFSIYGISFVDSKNVPEYYRGVDVIRN